MCMTRILESQMEDFYIRNKFAAIVQLIKPSIVERSHL